MHSYLCGVNMRSLILLSAVCMQFLCCLGEPSGPEGIGVFAYQDSTGKRYSGSYGLKDGQVQKIQGDDPTVFKDIENSNSFFPLYFGNLNNLLQETFANNLGNQQLAYDAAQKAYELTANKGYDYSSFVPNYADRFNPFSSSGFVGFGGLGNMPGFGGIPNFGNGFGGANFAHAAAAAGPGFTQHFDHISPGNPAMPNVNVVNSFSDAGDSKPGYYSVSSSSYSKSANVNGQEVSERGAETAVNNNGKITKYSVHS